MKLYEPRNAVDIGSTESVTVDINLTGKLRSYPFDVIGLTTPYHY